MAESGDAVPLVRKDISVQELDISQPCLNCNEQCPGFQQHFWRKSCLNCRCPRLDHDIIHDNYVTVKEHMGLQSADDSETKSEKERAIRNGYSWVPTGLSADKIDEYMRSLPNSSIPKLHTPGETNRDKQMILQIPRQDLALDYLKHLESEEAKEQFQDFLDYRDHTAFGIGRVRDYLPMDMNCNKCDREIEAGDIAVFADRLGDDVCWHPFCFCCSTCNELLVDLAYFTKDGKIYDERHYAEEIIPRCESCDELIFASEYTKAMNENFHGGHFACNNCDTSLTGHRYILRDEHPYCIKCYEDVFANTCEECGKKIGTDFKDLSYKDRHWHEHCFFCQECKTSLVDAPFGAHGDELYCGTCHEQKFAARCDACGDIFKSGMKKMEYKGQQWHEHCFVCTNCKNTIGSNSFIPKEGKIHCVPCYEDIFGTKCTSCKKIISAGGVTYRGDPYHRECFLCTDCQKQLAGVRFTSREDKPYCAECFGERFAKKCTSCTKPITGMGGTKFISFEQRNWHNDCFNCGKCQASLVGQGFLTDGDEILCPACGQA
ncbi:four and a half LIM domains protein 2-like isoform X1 [Ptychodera flava]|uniref:four and a half LIM domains protein 2-like isoform X1 n=1 Tax=Ptychodera flava TaxID=63121 RepID=UPI003969BFF0